MMHITNPTATMGDSLAWLPRNLTEAATNTGSLILWGSSPEPRMERRVVVTGFARRGVAAVHSTLTGEHVADFVRL